LPGARRAELPPSTRPTAWILQESQAVALWYNADLRIARLEAQQAAAIANTAGRWEDPLLGLDSGEKSVDGDPRGFLRDAGKQTRSWINAATLSITVPLSGRLRAERQASHTGAEAALLRAVEAEHTALRAVRDAWARWSAAEARAALLAEHLALLGEFADASGALAMAGELPPTGGRLFAIERIRKEADLERARAAAAEMRSTVLQLLGLAPDAPLQLLPGVAAPAAFPELPDLLGHPVIARHRAEYQLAEDRLRVELRKQYPDLTFSPAYTDEQDETSLVLGLGVPVPVWNANRRGIAEAVAARDLARARAEAAYQQLIAEAAQAQAALQGCRAQRTRLVEGVAPVVDAQTAEALALLKMGEIDIVLLFETLAQAFETKQELLDATLAEALAASRYAAIAATSPITTGALVEDVK
jgi:cobalt-zinc-cadmium efflux system outer membrane protein